MRRAIVIIGGYNSLWPVYLQMARAVEDISGWPAIGVPLLPWDWWAAGREKDASNILHKLDDTLAWARRRLGANRFILIGHSAGGLLARLYLHDGPVWGHVYAGVQQVDAIITLGSPHCSEKGTETGWFLSSTANRLVPGTPYTDTVGYYTVAGRYLLGRPDGDYRQRRAFGSYRFFAGQGDLWGDGVVPVQSAMLDGAEAVVLDGVAHSRKYGVHWYGGSPALIRRWWIQEPGGKRQDAG